jgi:hypothetical protein
MVVGIVHGAIAFTGELFGTVGVGLAAEYIMSLHIANNECKWNHPATRGIDGTGFVSIVHDIQSFLQTGNEGAIMWSIGRKGVTLQFSGLSPTKNFVVGAKWGFNLATKL